jgi:hypothetical protein
MGRLGRGCGLGTEGDGEREEEEEEEQKCFLTLFINDTHEMIRKSGIFGVLYPELWTRGVAVSGSGYW